MAVVSIFNSVSLAAINLNVALANATSATLHQGENAIINGRSYNDVFEIDFVSGGLSFQDLLAGTSIGVNSANAITTGTITGLIENVSDGINWSPNWMIQDTSISATILFSAYQTPSNTDDLLAIAQALKGDDIFTGSSSAADSIVAGDGNDIIFVGGTGGNSIDGGKGFDVAVYASLITDHAIIKNADGSVNITTTILGTASIDKLSNIEQVEFSDYTLVLDLTSAQDSLVFQLYQAAFARLPDTSGFRYWATQADTFKLTAVQLADAFLASPEFAQRYGTNPSNADFVTALYSNVLGRAPDTSGFNYWLSVANHGAPKDQMLIAFATSVENLTMTGPHTSNGFWTLS